MLLPPGYNWGKIGGNRWQGGSSFGKVDISSYFSKTGTQKFCKYFFSGAGSFLWGVAVKMVTHKLAWRGLLSPITKLQKLVKDCVIHRYWSNFFPPHLPGGALLCLSDNGVRLCMRGTTFVRFVDEYNRPTTLQHIDCWQNETDAQLIKAWRTMASTRDIASTNKNSSKYKK